jgi:hypothetical protein
VSSSSSSSAPLPGDGEAFVRLARHRTIYDVALAFYAVLAAFALDGPLKALANSLATSPAGQGLDDWTTRLLTLTLLLQAAVWLYALVVSVELNDRLSGTYVYQRSLVQFWAGVVMVVILMTLGRTVKLGTAAFLSASIPYVAWSLLFSLISLMMRQTSAGESGKSRCWRSGLAQLWSRRSTTTSSSQPENPIAKWNVREAVVILVILAILVLWAQNAPAHGVQPFVLALIWLLIVITSIIQDYSRFPDYYGV